MRSRPASIAISLVLAVAFALRAASALGEDTGRVEDNDASKRAPVMTLPDTVVEAEPPRQPGGDFPPGPPPNPAANDPVVRGSRLASPLTRGYRAESSTTGTLMDVPNQDIPATVNVVPIDLIRDQQATELRDVVRDFGGVSLGGDAFFRDQILLRGIAVTSRDYRRDGFLDPTFVPRDFQSVERVEVLKGPSSVVYGAGTPAGTINLISKQPLHERFGRMDYEFGSFGENRFTADANSPIAASGKLLARVNVALEDSNGFRDFDYTNRKLVSPGATWEIDDCTRLTWLGEYHTDSRRGDQGIPAIDGDPLALGIRRYIGEPANDHFDYEEFRQSLVLTREVNDDWTLSIGGWSLFDNFGGSVTAAAENPLPGILPDLAPPEFHRLHTDVVKDEEQTQSMVANLAGQFCTGGWTHHCAVGMEYVYYNSDSRFRFGVLPKIDAADPVYNDPPWLPLGLASFPVYRQQRVGGYAHDLVELSPHWKVLGGMRLDYVDFQFDRTLILGLPEHLETDEIYRSFTPRGGIIYQPLGNEELSFYFTYGRSFVPPNGGAYTNEDSIKPILGETYETGVKTLLMPGLSLEAALFRTIRRNADLNTSAFFLTQVGEERSQGVEINLLGDLTDRWHWLTNYTYADVRLHDPDNPDLDGKRQRNVPYNSGSIWTRYDLVRRPQSSLGAALGLISLDDRAGDLQNTFRLPGFTRWDAGLYYTRKRLEMSLYVENLFDAAYAASSIDEYQIFPGAPITAKARVGLVF